MSGAVRKSMAAGLCLASLTSKRVFEGAYDVSFCLVWVHSAPRRCLLLSCEKIARIYYPSVWKVIQGSPLVLQLRCSELAFISYISSHQSGKACQ